MSCDHNVDPYIPRHSPFSQNTDMSEHTVRPHSELEDFTTTKSEAFIERLDHFSLNPEGNAELVGATSVSCRRQATPYCDFCHSVITARCKELEELEEEGETFRGGTVAIPVKDLREGVVMGCQDCDVILTTIDLCYPGEDGRAHLHLRRTLSNTCSITRAHLFLELGLWSNLEGSSGNEIVELFRANLPVINPVWENVVERPLPSESTASHEAFCTIEGWIDECLRNHSKCNKSTTSHLPKRILEVSGTQVYLREIQNRSAKYACLSHCWGVKGPAFRLTTDTADVLRRGVDTEALPKTFREAVTICTRLSIEFIWIDALCIMQDDANDWRDAATTMAGVYENAFICIAATWSSNSDGGCFSQIHDKYKAKKLGSSGLYARHIPPKFPFRVKAPSSFQDWPLITRGWVYQERLLSPRMVHFAKHHLYWECNSVFLSEHGAEDKDYDKIRKIISKTDNIFFRRRLPLRYRHPDPVVAWQKIVSDYTKLHLTYNSDILPALAGIVQREMRYRKDDTYIAGMWKQSLLDDLGFYSQEGRRPDTRSPTWSWTHLCGEIYWIPIHRIPTVKLLDLTFTPTGPANVGEVADARIKILGPTLSVQFESTSGGSGSVSLPLISLDDTIPGSGLFEVRVYGHAKFEKTWDVKVGDNLTVFVLSCRGTLGAAGMLLKKLTSGEYIKIAAVIVLHRKCTNIIKDRRRTTMKEYIDSLPVCEADII